MGAVENCKVLSSFGSANGGLKLAKLLRNRLREEAGWNIPSSAYIDCVDLLDTQLYPSTTSTPLFTKDDPTKPLVDFDNQQIVKII